MLDVTFAVLGGITLIGLTLAYISKYIPLMFVFSALSLVVGTFVLTDGIQSITGFTATQNNTYSNFSYTQVASLLNNLGVLQTTTNTTFTTPVLATSVTANVITTSTIPVLYTILIALIFLGAGLYCGFKSLGMKSEETEA